MSGLLGDGMAQSAHDALSGRAEQLLQQECDAGIKTEVECSAAFAKNAAKPTEIEQKFINDVQNNREIHAKGVYATLEEQEASALNPEMLEKIDDLGKDRHPATEQALQEVLKDPGSFGVGVENNIITSFGQGEHDFESQGFVSSIPSQP